jgi:hypothetical protein
MVEEDLTTDRPPRSSKLDHAQDDVAVALADAAHRFKTVDDGWREPDEPLTLGLALEANGPSAKVDAICVECGGCDGNADQSAVSGLLSSFTPSATIRSASSGSGLC